MGSHNTCLPGNLMFVTVIIWLISVFFNILLHKDRVCLILLTTMPSALSWSSIIFYWTEVNWTWPMSPCTGDGRKVNLLLRFPSFSMESCRNLRLRKTKELGCGLWALSWLLNEQWCSEDPCASSALAGLPQVDCLLLTASSRLTIHWRDKVPKREYWKLEEYPPIFQPQSSPSLLTLIHLLSSPLFKVLTSIVSHPGINSSMGHWNQFSWDGVRER